MTGSDSEKRTAQNTSAVVVGFGSIGSRHARCLQELGADVAVVSKRPVSEPFTGFESLSAALKAKPRTLVIIANETSRHFDTLQELIALRFDGAVLVEKPLTDHPVDPATIGKVNGYTAYCLRSHPAVRRLVAATRDCDVYSAHLYVGGYLPTWRPGRDYRDLYSAKKELGGGVLRDLSHELDLLCLLTGRWQSVVASIGHRSTLEISADGVCSMLVKTDRCQQCLVEMNYLHQKDSRREIILQTSLGTFELSFTPPSVKHNGEPLSFDPLPDSMYHEQLRTVIENRSDELCSLADGLEIVTLIDAAELSESEGRWVGRVGSQTRAK